MMANLEVAEERKSPAEIPAEAARYFAWLPEPAADLPVRLTVTDPVTVHHLAVVCRAKPGERVVLIDQERGTPYAATLNSLARDHIIVTLDARLETPPSALPPVTLIAALVKEQRWDVLLQRTTELGVQTIQPVASERSIVRLGKGDEAKKLSRWGSLLRAAAEQSEGLFIPSLEAPAASVKALLGAVTESSSNGQIPLKILLMERGADRLPLKNILQKEMQSDRPVMLAIGPEGGWTDDEANSFREAGFQFASLGTRILRSETAAMAAMAAVVYEAWEGSVPQ